MSLLIPFPFWLAAEQKGGQGEVSISLAFIHLIGIDLHLWPFSLILPYLCWKGTLNSNKLTSFCLSLRHF